MSDLIPLAPGDIVAGASLVFEREVTEDDVLVFARLSGDENALHVDAAYAASTNFGGRIAHGAFQVGIASAMLGMRLPGRNVLLGSVNARFPAPLRYPARISVAGTITSWNAQMLAGRLDVAITEVASGSRTAEVRFTFTLHDVREARSDGGHVAPLLAPNSAGLRRGRTVLVTGASGALGSSICASLVQEHDVIAVVRRHTAPGNIRSLPNVTQVIADLSRDDATDLIRAALGARSLFGIVHTAWPGAPSGGLLGADQGLVRGQLAAGTSIPLALARLIFETAGSEGGRLVLIGSTAGSFKPHVPTGAYSLGKAAMEAMVRLIAPELARKRITVNVVSPGFIAAGINAASTARQQLLETAAVPMGRLCTVEDVIGTIDYLLSDASAFVSGQNIVLSGARI